MDTKNALTSKTIGFNGIVSFIVSILLSFGIDLPPWFYPAVSLFLAVGNFVLRFITKSPITLSWKPVDSGGTPVSVVFLVCVTVSVPIISAGLINCSHNQQSATQQMMEQDADPAAISLAVYADGQDAYIEALELYRPYKATIKENNPELDAEIVGYFRAANEILDDWKLLGAVPDADKDSFREYLRTVSIRLAEELEK